MSSGLGPTTYLCGRCGKAFTTHRREWNEMGRWFDPQDAGKLRYLVVSLVYVLLIGVVGGALVATAIRFIQIGPQAEEVPLSDYASYGPYSVLIGVGIGCIQILRVRFSKQRSLPVPRPEYVSSFFSFHTNLQLLVLIALLLPGGICWLIGYGLNQ
jgi:hypothetical protein